MKTYRYVNVNNKIHDFYIDFRYKGKRKYYKSGIYGIYLDDILVYIGSSKNMYQRLSQHLQHMYLLDTQENKYIQLNRAVSCGHSIRFEIVEECSPEIRYVVEARHIREKMPPLNVQIPFESNPKKCKISKKAKIIKYEEILGIDYMSEINDEDIKENIEYYCHITEDSINDIGNKVLIAGYLKRYIGKELNDNNKRNLVLMITNNWQGNHLVIPWRIIEYIIRNDNSYKYELDAEGSIIKIISQENQK